MPINLQENSKKLVQGTFLIYGESGSGKTRLAATFERPLFFSDSTEKGWVTIEGMDRKHFYDPEIYPVVEPMVSPEDVNKLLVKYTKDIQAGKFKTLVFDSLSFYGDSYLSILSRKGEFKDGRQMYNVFYNHIRYIMIEMHKLPCNVVWICLAKEPTKPGEDGGVLLPGKSGVTAPARCSYWLYTRVVQDDPNEDPIYEVHTKKFGTWPARVRGAPEDMPSVLKDNSFRGFLDIIGKTI